MIAVYGMYSRIPSRPRNDHAPPPPLMSVGFSPTGHPWEGAHRHLAGTCLIPPTALTW